MNKFVVMFTGGIGVGKSVGAEFLSEYFTKQSSKVVIINSYKDLYLPFIQKAHPEITIHNNRQDIITLIKSIHKKYGDEKGSELLAQFIDSTNNDIYIIDGKRSPKGIIKTKNLFQDNCVIIGVVADDIIRLERILRRKKNIDRKNSTKKIYG